MKEGKKLSLSGQSKAELNFDTHGDALGKNISYEKGRDVPSQKGN
jgi:hypothetical protein